MAHIPLIPMHRDWQQAKPKIPKSSKGALRAGQSGARRGSESSKRTSQKKVKSVGPRARRMTIVGELKAIRKEIGAACRGYLDTLYQRLSEVCELGMELGRNEEKWAEFCQDPYWKKMDRGRPNEEDRQEAVRFALKFVCGPNKQKSASLYWRALGPLLKDGHHPSALPQVIREASISTANGKISGLRALARHHATKRPAGNARRDNEQVSEAAATNSSPLKKGDVELQCELHLGARASDRFFKLPLGTKVKLDAIVEKQGKTSVLRILDVSPIP